MRYWQRISLALTVCGGFGCARATPPANSGEAESAKAEAQTEQGGAAESEDPPAPGDEAGGASGALTIPTECVGSAGACALPAKFVKALCQDAYIDVALHLFHKGTPWRRAYLTRKTKAWNASGGASASEDMLAFDEEVLILFERKSNLGGMQVSGAGSGYDALRWDGSCVTLSGEELTNTHPPKALTAKIEWRRMGSKMQDALRESESITKAYRTRRSECQGAVSGTVSLKCVKADQQLSDLIVEHVREGGTLGEPENRP